MSKAGSQYGQSIGGFAGRKKDILKYAVERRRGETAQKREPR